MNGDCLDRYHIRQALRRDGYCYLRDLPNGYDYASQLSRFGSLVPQYDGELIRDIMPDANLGDDVVAANGISELFPHTEWYEFPGVPPRYVALWCVRPCGGAGGETTLADGYRMLRIFSSGELAELFRKTYRWRSRPDVARAGADQAAEHPILENNLGNVIIRFSTLDIVTHDDLSARYVAAGLSFFVTSHVAIRIQRGALLLWDNWRMLHARNAFSDRRRHLRRALIESSDLVPGLT